jgi:flagellar biogenesis protein FliO
MGEFLGIENSALKFVIAFVLVMALIGLTAWLIRQFSSARPNSMSGARKRQPRLAVLDSAVVDARRRLVLIRRDNVEHLLMIGGPTDVVVEANVVRAQSAAAPQPVAPPRAAPQRAPIEPIEPDYDPSLVPFDEPYYEEPAPRPVPRERPAPVRAPAPAAAAAPRVAAAPRPAPMVEPRVAPAPAAPQRQTQYADMAQRLEAALRAPTTDAPTRPAPEPRIAPNAPSFAAREEPQLAPPPSASEPEPKPAGDVFSSLEEEMANLLKPSGGKDPA